MRQARVDQRTRQPIYRRTETLRISGKEVATIGGIFLITRLALLASIAWIIGLTRPVFDLFGHPVSWRDIVLVGGGFFLLYKGTREIHHRLEGDGPGGAKPREKISFSGVFVQIVLLDIVFSLDSVITAVGMASAIWVMAAAIVIAVAIMLGMSKPLAEFVERYPTVKMLALSFLLLIGMTLIADGAGFHVPKGYIYAAIGFSVGVEALNQLAARRRRSRRVILKRCWRRPQQPAWSWASST